MVYFCTKFHMPTFNGLSVITTKPKAQQNSPIAISLVTLRWFIPLCYNKISPLYYNLKKHYLQKSSFLSAILPYITWGTEVTWCYSSSHLTCSCVILVVINDCRSLTLWHWDVVQWHNIHAKFCENWSLVHEVKWWTLESYILPC